MCVCLYSNFNEANKKNQWNDIPTYWIMKEIGWWHVINAVGNNSYHNYFNIKSLK